MRFATIFAALYAVTGARSAPVGPANTGTIGTATDKNFNANVELINNVANGVRMTYATVDVDHRDKLVPPVNRFCWDVYTESSAFNCF